MAILANELRIGNWIETYMVFSFGAWYDKDGNRCGNDVITEPTIRRKQIDIEDLKIISASNLTTYRPIELTPEILVACGFKKHKTHKDAYDFGKYRVYLKPCTLHIDVGNDYYPRVSHTFYNLHELQNIIFSLTGEELEVNL